MENLNLEINAQGGHEIRTGELPPVHVSSGFLEESVSIQSLTKFIQARVANGQASYQDSCLTICLKSGKAEFVSDMNRKNRETYLLRAKFFVEENDVSRAIVEAKTFDLTAFRKWVSRMKPYFFDSNEHRELSDRLLTYSASAQIEISDKKDNQASFSKNYTQQASSKLQPRSSVKVLGCEFYGSAWLQKLSFTLFLAVRFRPLPQQIVLNKP